MNKSYTSLFILLFFCFLGGGSTDAESEQLWLWFFFIIIFVVVVVVIEQSKMRKRKDKIRSVVDSIQDFNPSITINNSDEFFSFMIDETREKILLVFSKNTEKYLMNYDNVISVELIEDTNVIFSKSTIRTIGGGLAGGILAGGAGMVVGGLSGKNKGVKTVSKICVKLLIRNYSVPSLYLYCYNGTPIKTDSMQRKVAINEAMRIIDHVSVVIDKVDKSTKKMDTSQHLESVAEELEKLAALEAKGILTAEEFADQKKKLLAK